MYGLRYTQRQKHLKGADTHLQSLIASALPRWEKLTDVLGALDQRLLTFIDSEPIEEEPVVTPRAPNADGGVSFYNSADLTEELDEEDGEEEASATADEGASSPDGAPGDAPPWWDRGAPPPPRIPTPCPCNPSHDASLAQARLLTWSTRRCSSSSWRRLSCTRSS